MSATLLTNAAAEPSAAEPSAAGELSAGPASRPHPALTARVSGIVLHRSVALQHFRSAGAMRDVRFATSSRLREQDARSCA